MDLMWFSWLLTVDKIALSGDKNISHQRALAPDRPHCTHWLPSLWLWGWTLQKEVTCQVAWLTGVTPFLEQSYTLNTCGVAGPQALAREDKPGITGLGQHWDCG